MGEMRLIRKKSDDDELRHYGVLGMKWGKRRALSRGDYGDTLRTIARDAYANGDPYTLATSVQRQQKLYNKQKRATDKAISSAQRLTRRGKTGHEDSLATQKEVLNTIGSNLQKSKKMQRTIRPDITRREYSDIKRNHTLTDILSYPIAAHTTGVVGAAGGLMTTGGNPVGAAAGAAIGGLTGVGLTATGMYARYRKGGRLLRRNDMVSEYANSRRGKRMSNQMRDGIIRVRGV